jgi:hypothetical protein
MLFRQLHEPLLPFPSLPETVKATHPGCDLTLRPFGLYENDLNLDFDRTPRPLLVTRILECCTRHTQKQTVEQSFFWALPIGKRIECLLTLLAAGTGTTDIPITFRCPNTKCGQQSEVEISLTEIAGLQAHAYQNERLVVSFETESLVLRRPTGGDQLKWLSGRYADQDAASRAMLGTLLLDCEEVPLADEWLPVVERALEEEDPLVNFSLLVDCSNCDEETLLELDLEEVSLRELRRAQLRLLAAVHRLAASYHWSEEQIFSIPYWRRAYYLRLIEAEKN